MDEQDDEPVALHVLVVAFHHKKGMQVEYAYPPLLSDGEPCELPEKWKYLPSLCLPDGAHNHEADTIYFHLPHLTKDSQTVFGVSCYRQIDAEKVANKTADITRNTVQKSVCVLTTLPIYGYIQERLKVTTKVYFKGADFSDVRDLQGLYEDLNNTNWRDRLMHVDLEDKYGKDESLPATACRVVESESEDFRWSQSRNINEAGVRIGICVSEVVRIFGRNILVLFKLLLLERRVLFFNSPVAPLVKTITSLLALLPANLPQGLAQAAATKCRGSPFLSAAQQQNSRNGARQAQQGDTAPGYRNECEKSKNSEEKGKVDLLDVSLTDTLQLSPSDTLNEVKEELTKIINVGDVEGPLDPPTEGVETSLEQSSNEGIASESDELSERRSSNSSLTSVTSRGSIMSPPNSLQGTPSTEPTPNFSAKISSLKGRLSGALNYWTGREKTADKPSSTATPNPSPSEPGDDIPVSPSSGAPLPPMEGAGEPPGPQPQHLINAEKYAALEPHECGLPLQIFTKGNLLHPYLSLQYLDVLTAPSTRAFVVGASNTLFIHKKNFYEVLIQIEEGKIDMGTDPDLKRQLSLSIEDLRFAENLVRQVEAVNGPVGPGTGSEEGFHSPPPPADVFLEGVGWMGGEEWLRHQFKVYLLTLLRASLCPDMSPESEVFNSSFLAAWRETHNYRMWLSGGPYPSLNDLAPGHPHAGHLSITDMRIRLSHTIQALDKGRRLNQTLASTGTAVVKTKEAVGGALTSAKGALSTLWTSFTATSPPSGRSEEDTEEAVEAIESAAANHQAEVCPPQEERGPPDGAEKDNEEIQLKNLS